MDSNTAYISPGGTQPQVSGGRRRVLIVDDQPIVRLGLRHLLEGEHDLIVCGETASVRGARAAITESNPDALIAEIGLKTSDGMELVREVRAHHAQLPILVLSVHDEFMYARRMLAAGIRGYIMKEAASEHLLAAVRCVLNGGIYVSEAVAAHMIQRLVDGDPESTADPIDQLTNRELQILQLIGKGVSSREAARSLHLSVKTVESHRQRIKRKLNLDSGLQLTRYALMGSIG